MLRLGIDIGGTFTDFVLLDQESGSYVTHKQLTTPKDPSKSVLSGVPLLLSKAAVLISELREIVHGTTLVTNAVIQRDGPKVGMICTEGFASILDIAREQRYESFDLRIPYPSPLVPLGLRAEVRERIGYDGEVMMPLDEADVVRAAAHLEESGVRSVAICFLNSSQNDSHERRACELVVRAFPALHVSSSAEVFPFIREYERWTTATVNAYAQPLVDEYLTRLESGLESLGFSGRLFLMTSNGGMMTTQMTRRFPVRLLESGPAAGIEMAAVLGSQLSQPDLLAFDMGGTTAKGALIRDNSPLSRYEIEVAHTYGYRSGSGLVIKTPALDLIEIGAGGGSIASVDQRNLIQVGPQSSGAEPGPACYGRGGRRPTVTDADLVLGYLDSGYFLGGEMVLDVDCARAAIRDHVAAQVGLDAMRAAWGIHEQVNENIARAFRNHAAHRGFDYRHSVMVASGGAAPVHAARVARKLRVPTVIFPANAGVMSAFGLLVCPLRFDTLRSRLLPAEGSIDVLNRELRELGAAARAPLVAAGLAPELISERFWLDMRYRGQGFEVEVALPAQRDLSAPGELQKLFDAEYRAIFHTSIPDQEVEIVALKAQAVGPDPPRAPLHPWRPEPSGGPALKGRRTVHVAESQFAQWPVYDRYALEPGQKIDGPAIVEERETTCIIGEGDRARLDRFGHLIATIQTP